MSANEGFYSTSESKNHNPRPNTPNLDCPKTSVSKERDQETLSLD